MFGKARGLVLLRDIAVYGGVFVFCLLFLYRVMALWQADFHVPFYYSGDALLSSLPIKGIIDHGWYLENPNLAAPGIHQLYDYPFGELFYFLCFKVMALFSHSFGLILNAFFILSFPLTAVTALFAFRRLGFSYPPAIFGSVLYAFQPYHFQRGEEHLFLGVYFFLPLALLVLLWVGAEQPLLSDGKISPELPAHLTSEAGEKRSQSSRLAFGGAALICLLVSCSGFYYAFFTGFFLMIAGVFAALRRHRTAPLVKAIALAALIVCGMALCVLPNQFYWHKEGRNPVVGKRYAQETETYGLKIIQLLLPVDGHRLPSMDASKRWYNDNAPLSNENRSASLGVVGSTGFLFLLACTMLPERLLVRLPRHVRLLSQLNLWGVLLATIGGFSMAFAMEVSPQIRAYNRISIYIALFSLCTVVACLDALYKKWHASASRRWAFVLALGLLLVVGLVDQDGYLFRRNYGATRDEFSNDARFVQSIEASVPTGSMVFQLPFSPFPEYPPSDRMVYYDHLRGYMHSKHLRWSYATMQSRPADKWPRTVSALPVPAMVREVRKAGFAGIYIDQYGYKDNAAALEAQIAHTPGVLPTPIRSDNKRFSFWRFATPR